MKLTQFTLALLFGSFALSCSQPSARAVDSSEKPAAPAGQGLTVDDDDDGDDGEEEDEVEVPLDQVPAAVKAAALAAVPGIVLEEAEMEVENGVTIYDVEGELDGVEYEIEITAAGVVQEIEQESGDDDGDGHEHHDGDHDD